MSVAANEDVHQAVIARGTMPNNPWLTARMRWPEFESWLIVATVIAA
jgi:hypothetical protein